MTIRIGTATHHYDLLNRFEAAVTGEGHAWGKTFVGAGNGTLTGTGGEPGGYRGGLESIAEMFTLQADSDTTFSVTGSTSGDLGTATVGTAFVHPKLNFRINAGTTPFAAGDTFTLNTTPPWTRLRRNGVRNPTFRTGNLTNLANLYDGSATTVATLPIASLPALAAIEQIGAEEIKAITLGCGTNPATNSPRDFELQWSDNGTAWTTAQAWTGATWTSQYQRRSYIVTSSPSAHVYWRLRVTAIQSGGSQLDLNELDFLPALDADYGIETRAQALYRAPGQDGTQQIHIGCELYEDAARGIYNLNWSGSRYYAPLLTLRSQINASGLRTLPLANSPFAYWFAICGQCAVIVCKVGSVYVSAYLGFGDAYEPPHLHEFPMVVGACHDAEDLRVDSTIGNFRAFFDPGRYGLVAMYPDNLWRPHANRSGTGSGDSGDSQTPGKVYPFALSTNGDRMPVRENLDGSNPLIPLLLVSTDPRHQWGELHNCFWTPGFNLNSEATIEQDGFTHLVFQNCFRVTSDNFFALRFD